ncbi:DUF4287 domain-containing protein [soil metagenome]
MTPGDVLTGRQAKWFATVRANFETATGKPIADWLEIMTTCPAETPKARAAWLKTEHGVGSNHAALILEAMKPAGTPGWDAPAELRAALWSDPGSLAILEAVEAMAAGTEGMISGQRKAFTSFSRAVQFAAMRPLKGGRALLALKLAPEVSARLSPSVRKESWSERLSAGVELPDVGSVDAEIGDLFAQAAANG